MYRYAVLHYTILYVNVLSFSLHRNWNTTLPVVCMCAYAASSAFLFYHSFHFSKHLLVAVVVFFFFGFFPLSRSRSIGLYVLLRVCFVFLFTLLFFGLLPSESSCWSQPQYCLVPLYFTISSHRVHQIHVTFST